MTEDLLKIIIILITCSYLSRGKYMTVLETSILKFCIGFMGFHILFTILDEIKGNDQEAE